MSPRTAIGIAPRQVAVLPAFAGVSCLLALIQVFCFAFGIVGIRMSQPIAVAVLVPSAVLSWLFATRFRRPKAADSPAAAVAVPAARWTNGLFRILAAGVLLWAGWVWLQLWILAALRSPYAFDSLAYHLPAIHEWVLRGRVAFIDTIPEVPFVNFPMGVELTSFFTHHLFRTSRLVDACNLWYWPLAFTALALIAGRLGARGIWRWLAGGLIFGASAFVSGSASAYIDAGFASTVMASVAAACVFAFDGGRPLGWKATLLGINVGLMLGAKGFGLPFSAVVLFAALAGWLWIRGFASFPAHGVRMIPAAVAALAVGGYWYVRNALVSGNPIYPLQLAIGWKVLAPGFDHTHWADWSIPTWLTEYPPWARIFVVWLQPDAPVQSVYSDSGLGYLWIAGALPAIIYLWVLAVRRRRSYPIVELAFVTVLVAALLGLVNMRWYARYTFWLHALGLPCLAVVLSDAVARWPSMRRHLITVVLAFAAIGVAVWESDRTLGLEWEYGREPESGESRPVFRSTLQALHPGLSDAPGFEEFLQADTIGRWRWQTTRGSLFNGALTLPLGKRKTLVVPPGSRNWRDPGAETSSRREPTLEEMLVLREAGVEWFWWESDDPDDLPGFLVPYAGKTYRFECSADGYLHLVRLRWADAAGNATNPRNQARRDPRSTADGLALLQPN